MKQLRISLVLLALFTLVLGLVYPLTMTGLALLLFSDKAGGSLVKHDGAIIGSSLIGQVFAGPRYLHGRPLATGHDALNSGGSNSGPSNAKHLEQVKQRVAQVRKENGLADDAPVPADLVLASGSGLDPHIGLESAVLQAGRIAAARGLDRSVIMGILERHVERPFFGVAGRPVLNVLIVNLALDEAEGKR